MSSRMVEPASGPADAEGRYFYNIKCYDDSEGIYHGV
jgi:hypothetical protein